MASLAAVLALTAAGLIVAAGRGLPLLGLVAALLAMAALAAAGVAIHRHGEARAASEAAATDTARRYARLMAASYAWGGVVMLAIDRLGTLKWYHYGQYGTAMVLVGAGLFVYAHLLGLEAGVLRSDPLRQVARSGAAAQALLAMAGVLWLVASGKLPGLRGDWAANQVFVAGGLAITVVSALAVHSSRPR